MSSKKKGLLNRVLGKNKDAGEEDGGTKGKKAKKGKLEKQPSIRESVRSERAPTMHSMTHASEAPYQFEDQDDDGFRHGAPVTAVHEEDPYSPFRHSMNAPSNIHILSEGHDGGMYMEQPLSDSPQATMHRSSGLRQSHGGHAEAGHPNIIHFGGEEHGHAEPAEGMAIAGISRQPTILSPHGAAEAPRMLKPGDSMEIDPRNPPTFVVDDGVTLEIGDDETGYIPYEEYLQNLAKQPPPVTGGTYIVQGGGDVVIQDDDGNLIKRIPGTGVNAGRGEPQIHHPPHLIRILVSLSKRVTRPLRKRKPQDKTPARPLMIRKLPTEASCDVLGSVREPTGLQPDSFLSLLDLVDPRPRAVETEEPKVVEAEISRTEEAEAPSPDLNEGIQEEVLVPRPPVPTRTIPSTPKVESPELPPVSPTQSAATSDHNTETEPPMASPASFEEFEAADSDLALIGGENDESNTPKMSSEKLIVPTIETKVARVSAAFPTRSPATPIEEMSDLSEVILSPVRSVRSKKVTSISTSPSSSTRSDEDHKVPWRASQGSNHTLYGFRPESSPVKTPTTLAEQAPPASTPTSAHAPPTPTLTHSQADDMEEIVYQSRILPPPRPVRSPNRPSPVSSRKNSVSEEPMPLPPPMALVRQPHRNASAPIPIPSPTPVSLERSATQPRLNPSPKILAMIQRFEGTSRDTEDLGNVFVGTTTSLSFSPRPSLSRRGSGSSSGPLERMDYTSPWSSYSPPSSRPDTPDSMSEFGEHARPNLPTNMQIARGIAAKARARGGSVDGKAEPNWDLRPTSPSPRPGYLNTSRPSMVPSLPGMQDHPGLIRELSQKRLRAAE